MVFPAQAVLQSLEDDQDTVEIEHCHVLSPVSWPDIVVDGGSGPSLFGGRRVANGYAGSPGRAGRRLSARWSGPPMWARALGHGGPRQETPLSRYRTGVCVTPSDGVWREPATRRDAALGSWLWLLIRHSQIGVRRWHWPRGMSSLATRSNPLSAPVGWVRSIWPSTPGCPAVTR